MTDLDIVIPVYNEGVGITDLLALLRDGVKTPFRVLICYDFEEDDTLAALKASPVQGVEVQTIRNVEPGPHGAVRAGLDASTAGLVLVYMADDDYNIGLVDRMVEKIREGYDVVGACRFLPGGSMTGCRWYKAVPTRIATFTLFHGARLGVRDSTNSFRMFTRRVIDTIEIESRVGFTFGLELLVKSRRMGWRATELAALWREREDRPSRFRTLNWIPAYLRWYFYAFATNFLFRGSASVRRKQVSGGPSSAAGVHRKQETG